MKHFLLKACVLLLAASATALACSCTKPGSEADPSVTEIPEWMQTADPSDYEPDAEGYFEDEYIRVKWPEFLSFDFSQFNYAQYSGMTEDGTRVLFAYVPDDGASYADEIAKYDFDGYSEHLVNDLNSYYVLNEFSPAEVDGHAAMKIVYDYVPEEDPENNTVHVLQYVVNNRGWVLSFSFTSKGDIPAECGESILSMEIKD
ncbi:MAG: hypothetical protein IKG85_05695 [Clostridia bacterium]|nr:hypothetical protein [Clostridia bacterium]